VSEYIALEGLVGTSFFSGKDTVAAPLFGWGDWRGGCPSGLSLISSPQYGACRFAPFLLLHVCSIP
jgi:hypothetical protein